MHLIARLRLLLVLGVLAAWPLHAQARDLNGRRFEVRGKQRTVYSRELKAAPRWTEVHASLPVDSLVIKPFGSIIYMRLSNNGFSADVRVWRNRRGAVDSLTTALTELSVQPSAIPSLNIELHKILMGSIRNDIASVCSAAALFAGAPARGVERFPLRVSFVADTFARQLRGTVISRYLRDSVSDGGTLRIVHDSVALAENSSTAVDEPTLRHARVDHRHVAGITVGTRVYDTARALTVAIADTTRLTGTETRRLPDSRTLTDTVIYERVRTARLLDSLTRRKEDERQYAAAGFGMVARPALDAAPMPDVQKPGVVDSLVARYRNTRVSAVRDSVLAVRNFVYIPGNRERIARVHVQQGDTVGALRVLTLDIGTPLSEWSYNIVRPVLDDPQLAMRTGINSNDLYEAFEYAFRHYPFGRTAENARLDSMEWCPPTVCAIVAQEWTRAHDSRLRNIGLMALYRMNPAVYADTVIAGAGAGAEQLVSLSEQAEGVRRASDGDPPVYMPVPGAPWREWFVWMRGETDETHTKRLALNSRMGINPSPGSPLADPLRALGITASPDLLRMAQLRFGISFKDTFQLKYATASLDTARFVYFTLLQSLGASLPSRGDVVNRLTSASAFERSMALSDVRALRYVRADTQVAREIESAMLDVLLDSLPLWPQLDTTRKMYVPIRKLTQRNETHVVADSLQPATITRLRAAGIDVQRTGWQLPNDQTGNEVALRPILQSGDFVVVPFESAWLVRLPNGARGGDATGGSCVLVRVGGRWYLVDALFWET